MDFLKKNGITPIQLQHEQPVISRHECKFIQRGAYIECNEDQNPHGVYIGMDKILTTIDGKQQIIDRSNLCSMTIK